MKSLVAEDEFISRQLLQRHLSKYGTCDVAINGAETITAFKAALDEDDPYNLLTLDIMMPEMDGKEVLRQIRKIESECAGVNIKGVKIIMISMKYSKKDKEIMSFFKEGCEGYLVKPIDPQQLIDLLVELGLVRGIK